MREFYFGPEDATPWYMRQMMDQDMVHLYTTDLSDPERYDVDESDNSVVVGSDFVMFFMSPCFLRTRGYDPVHMYGLKEFKTKGMDLIKSVSPLEIRGSSGVFRSKIQQYLNRVLDSLYLVADFGEAKDFVRSILVLLGADYPLEAISEDDISLYNTSYIASAKVLYSLNLFNPEEIRGASYYLKKVPQPNLWDVKDFLEASASFVAFSFLKSFLVLKEEGPSSKWSDLYDEAEKLFNLVSDILIVKIPDISTVNKKKELWVLNTHDFFYSILKKKMITLVEEIQPGLRGEFLEFHLPEQLQKVLNSRAVFRPWVKR